MEIRAVDDVLHQEVDDEAFAELYRRYECVVFRVVRARTPSDDVAEDITAHVFFKALIKADEWRGEGSYRSWLYGIARNAVSTWRNQKSRHAVVLEVVPDLEDPDPTPPGQVVIGEKRRRGKIRARRKGALRANEPAQPGIGVASGRSGRYADAYCCFYAGRSLCVY